MSLEQALAANTAALQALTAALQAGALAAPVVQPAQAAQPIVPAPAAPVPQTPPPAPVMPTAPFAPPGAPVGLPFTDATTAATWAAGVFQQLAAVNADAAQQKFGALMQSLGLADFSMLTPDKYAALHAGVLALKTEFGVA